MTVTATIRMSKNWEAFSSLQELLVEDRLESADEDLPGGWVARKPAKESEEEDEEQEDSSAGA